MYAGVSSSDTSDAERAKMKITMGILAAGMKCLSKQSTTEAFMNSVTVEVIPEVARVYVSWCNAQQPASVAQIDLNSIPMNLISLPARYAQMMSQLCGKLRMAYVEVYICPKAGCGFYRTTKDHDAICQNPDCTAKTYLYGKQNTKVCCFRYFRLPTLLRLLYANPVMARLLAHTYKGHLPSRDAMRGVHGKLTRELHTCDPVKLNMCYLSEQVSESLILICLQE